VRANHVCPPIQVFILFLLSIKAAIFEHFQTAIFEHMGGGF
jgi:hypothetical protein